MWIICAGAKRSGSTLQYNILSRLVEVTNSGKRITHFIPSEFREVKKKFIDYNGYKVIKTHIIYEELHEEIINGNAIIFYCIRDIRDVVVSYINKNWITYSREGIDKCIEDYLKYYRIWTGFGEILNSSRYEDFAFQISDELKKYSEVLKLELPEITLQEISKELDLHSVREAQNKIDEDKKIERFNNQFHVETLIHSNHISDGSTNQFLKRLNSTDIAYIESKAHDFLSDNGYKLYWPEIGEFVSFSQHADDYIGWQLLGKKDKGIVVEIGAFDGVHLSNSYSLDMLGWHSVCVEPNPSIFELLKRKRPSSHNLQCAVVGDSTISNITFYSEEIGVLSGCKFDEQDIKRRYQNRGLEYKEPEKIVVPAATLNSIFEKISFIDRRIDIISIDVEGFEIEVLNGIDLGFYDVGLFIIEANTVQERDSVQEFFNDFKQYKLIGTNRQNLFFLNRNWANREWLKSLDLIRFFPAKQHHPIREELTLDSVPPKFIETNEFRKMKKKFRLY